MFADGRERPTEVPAPTKAYHNQDFLNSSHGRLLRIQCEFEEPRVRLEANGIDRIVMVFGSARSKTPQDYALALEEMRTKAKDDPKVKPQLVRLERMQFLCRYHDETVKLSKLITEFSESRAKQGLPSYTVGTGGGPGMMEAAAEGAWRAGGKTVGFGISLPFEKGLNPYTTPELGFEFHYFFTRKFWMSYLCQGLVVAPGGYGTADELFEIMTLIQTGKMKRELPIILLGEEYWNQVLNLEAMEDFGLVGKEWRSMVHTCDTADAAFQHLREFWLSEEAKSIPAKVPGKSLFRHDSEKHYPQEEPAAKRPKLDVVPERPMPPKAYKNVDFIKSHHCRVFRIQCEFEETRHRLADQGIDNVLMFMGSGSVKSYEDHLKALNVAHREKDTEALERLHQQQPLLKYHEVARDLARKISTWSITRREQGKASYYVGTSGGPGLQESANEGAWEAGGKSLGIDGGVTKFNRFVTPELAFTFHYFFTRKFWMVYKCRGCIALPGGLGTCDELFEVLTLMQTGKIKRKIPIVLVGVEYWKNVLRWQKMADYGMISDYDVTQLKFTDSAQEAFEYIVSCWEAQEVDGKVVNQSSKALK